MGDPVYDIFLSYNNRDRTAVEQLAVQLQRAGFTPWLDAWNLPAGGDWQDGIDHGLRHSKGCAVFLGPHGFGDWQMQEMKVASSLAAHDPAFRFFLALLPGAPDPLDSATLPAFINLRSRINLREGFTAPRQFRHLTNAILGVAMGPSVPAEPDLAESPYRGLEPFDAEHAEFFFGRSTEIRKLLEKLRAAPFLAVIGPSGSGKSSLVLAGLIPALQNGQLPSSAAWPIVTMVPGPHPVESLAVALDSLDPQRSRNQLLAELQGSPQGLRLEAAALLRARPRGARLVLVVDQFEEIFTLCRNEAERETFLNLLLAAVEPDSPCLVVITMRADFYPRITEYPALAAEVETHQLLVGALTREGLTAAIEQPAFRKGLQFEPGLVSTILADMGGDAGALPLLQYALDELWKRQHGGLLTLEAYRASGGVGDAIATRANAVFEGLTPEQQAVARRILLRLTQPGEATEDTRRRAELDELVTGEAERPSIEAAVSALTAARLLTTSRDEVTGAPQVDVAHEALIRAWPRLRQWLDEDRQGLLIHRRLTEAAQEWQRTDHDPDLLYRGTRLAEATAFSRLQPDVLNERERTFLAESTALREREQATAAEAAAARERLRRRIVAGLGAFSVVALLLALLAGWQWREAGQQTAEALRQTGIAEDQASVARAAEEEAQRQAVAASNAESTAQAQADRAEQQAAVASTAQVEAQRQAAAAATAEVVAQSEAELSLARQLAAQSNSDLGNPALGRLLAIEAHALVPDDLDTQRALFSAAWDTPRLMSLLNGQPGVKRTLAFSPDGSLVAAGGDSNLVTLWDTATLQPTSPTISTAVGSYVWQVRFSPDGRWLAIAASSGAVMIWDIQQQQIVGQPVQSSQSAAPSVAFSPDGSLLASGGDDGAIHLWQVPGLQPAGPDLTGNGNSTDSLIFSPDSQRVISGDYHESVYRIWNVGDSTPQDGPVNTEQDGITDLAISPDGSKLYTAGSNGTIIVWDLAEHTAIGAALEADSSIIQSISLSQDGALLTAGTFNGLVRLWQLGAGTQEARDIASGQGPVFAVALNADGSRIGAGGVSATVSLWETARPKPLFATLKGMSGIPTVLTYSPDGETIATGSWDGEVLLWDRAGHQLGPPLLTHAERIPANELLLPNIRTITFSPDGKYLASGSSDGVFHLWDTATWTELWDDHLPLPGQSIHKIAFSPDSRLMAIAGGDGSLRLWQPDDPTYDDTLYRERLPDVFVDVAFSPDGITLASLTQRGHVRFWNVASRKATGDIPSAYTIPEQEETGGRIVFLGDGDSVAICDYWSGEVTYWRVSDGTLLQSVQIPDAQGMIGLARNEAGDTLAGISTDGDVYLWQASETNPEVEYVEISTGISVVFTPDEQGIAFFSTLPGYTRVLAEWALASRSVVSAFSVYNTLSDAVLSEDGSTIGASSNNGTAMTWDWPGGNVRFTEQAAMLDGGIWRLAFSQDRRYVGTVTGASVVQVWDMERDRQVGVSITSPEPTRAFAMSADGSLVAAGSNTGTIRVWNVATGQLVSDPLTFTPPDNGVAAAIDNLAFSPPPESYLLAFTSGPYVALWTIGDESPLGPPFTTAEVISSRVAFSPDGASLGFFNGQDGIELRDLAHNRLIQELLVGDVTEVNGIAIGPGSQMVAAGTGYGTIPLWSVASSAPIGEFPAGSAMIADVAFTPGGEALVAVDLDGRVTTWPTEPSQWEMRACQIANRNLTQAEWAQYIGDPDDPRRPYRKICPDLPADTGEYLVPAGSASPVPAGATA